MGQITADEYRPTLARYLRDQSEEALYQAGLLSQSFIESGLGPEDIIALHFDALEGAFEGLSYREQARALGDAHQFLLEIMIAYGVRYKEYLELKLLQTVRDAEAAAAHERERALHEERLRLEKDEILGMIAHELRTPITAARGSLDLAERSLERGQVEPLPKYIGSAREAMERLSRLTADLVEASRGELPGLELAPQEIGPIIAQAGTWVRSVAESKGIGFVVEPLDQPAQVLADSNGLLSVFGNLLSNAVRYTPAGGKVTIRCLSDDETLIIEVEDTGIGIAPENQERIFEKFYRGSDARKIDAQGLGLGLSFVQQMVLAHDGTIEVISKVGKGSKFRVLLPILAETRGRLDGQPAGE